MRKGRHRNCAGDFGGGATPERIAEDRHTRVTTMRQQIETAMARSGTRRQVDLALLISGRLKRPA